MKKETQNLDIASKKVSVIDNILAKKLVGGTGNGLGTSTGNEGIIAPCVHPVTPPPVIIIPGTKG